MFALLAEERRADMLRLAAANRRLQRHKEIGLSKISIVLRNLVFEDQMIPERIPSQVRKEAVILVPILPVMSKHHVWIE